MSRVDIGREGTGEAGSSTEVVVGSSERNTMGDRSEEAQMWGVAGETVHRLGKAADCSHRGRRRED